MNRLLNDISVLNIVLRRVQETPAITPDEAATLSIIMDSLKDAIGGLEHYNELVGQDAGQDDGYSN